MGKDEGILSILRRNCGQSSRDPLVTVRCWKLEVSLKACWLFGDRDNEESGGCKNRCEVQGLFLTTGRSLLAER